MKHVFIGPYSESFRLQFHEFAKDENMELILLDNFRRRVAKCMVLLKFDSSFLYKVFVAWLLRRKILKGLKGKKWDDAICFILYARIYESFGSYFVQYLRTNFPDCKVVVYYGDLVSRHKMDLNKCKKEVDHVFSFDISDAEKNDLTWCRMVYSKDMLSVLNNNNRDDMWDVTFVGTAKERYQRIITLYELLTAAGLKCDFHIVGVKRADRRYVGKIHYKKMRYKEIVQHVSNSHSILEVLQDGGKYPTTRFAEAMMFNKNLLTDCTFFADSNNRTPNIIYFNNPSELQEKDMIKLKKTQLFDNSDYIEMLSAQSMIKTIDGAIDGE